ncbi:MAG: cupin domain-containing protein, partial [Caulobacterales bacterium]|nr:cupin domain-containing protein [Caulobacterales bacterium]
MTRTVNLAEKFALFDAPWRPKIVGEVNDCLVKVVKFQGEFVWHSHPGEDEMFLIVEGVMRMEFRDRAERVGPGEFIIVPRGVEHRPVTETKEVKAVLFEPATVLNTGDAPKSERTVEEL